MPLAGLDSLDVLIEQCLGCGLDVITTRKAGHGLQVVSTFHSYRCWLEQRDDAPSWRSA